MDGHTFVAYHLDTVVIVVGCQPFRGQIWHLYYFRHRIVQFFSQCTRAYRMVSTMEVCRFKSASKFGIRAVTSDVTGQNLPADYVP
jgi:hypothetical protein